MTDVAQHINAKYNAAVHVQEIQSLIRGWEVRLYTYDRVHVAIALYSSLAFGGSSPDFWVSPYLWQYILRAG